ncbi:DUF2489 domain-containing protein [Marinomonas spartinae]|uniref:DUF2489 domain-containing protein n=1 Tax=Marinomonas spartinae TaxID=1792290 RepID=UPI0018F243F1|nr:DUF2489 domain-containing protein [Marinomonas spartinae]MBJ7556308.1 DUF2489 domain-containing protein [Marinomonas spartinae]
MSLTAFFSLLAVSAVVIVVALIVIVRQLKVAKIREERIKEGEKRVIQERQARIDSIQILLKTVGSEELGWIEASIRIKNLLDQLGLDLSDHKDICFIYDLHEQTEHIPTHEQWSALPKEARKKFRVEMDNYEQQHAEQLMRAKNALLSYSFQ